MKKVLLLLNCLLAKSLSFVASAAVITVTTTNNINPGPGQISFSQALTNVRDGDEIRFNIPGPGPHYIETPATGYPLITNSNVTIDGYSQPGSAPNTNSILAPNTAKIRVVLDSRNGGHRVMTFPPTAPNDDTGYGETESAVLGFVDGKNSRVQGLSFLGVPDVGAENNVALYFISFARGASGRVSGCWLGIDPNGQTISGASDGVTGFRYRGRDAAGTTTNIVLINDVVIGVAPQATNAVGQFNVIVGISDIPIIIEGDATRISGNFISVLPDGLHDYNVALDPNLTGRFEGAIEIGRGGNNTLIGTDGDGINDENERNVLGGMLPESMGGYEHLIEFYGQNPGTNVVVAGNYIGVGIDGQTRFTNGIPVLNASGSQAQYRLGSNFDGVSDAIEGNVIANNYPSSLFPAAQFKESPDTLNFLSELNAGATVSLRGNTLINNFPFPTSPLRDVGVFWANYYSKALLDPNAGVTPALAAGSTRTRLVGTLPSADPSVYPVTVLDLYVADPIGMTNGMAAGIPELPEGFVQGLRYLGSFIEGSATDMEKQPGAFVFDVSQLNLAAGTLLTLTANYTGSTGGDGEATLNVSQGATGVTISWADGGFTLQSASSVIGPWSDEATTGTSFTTPASGAARFFRLQASGTGSSSVPVLTSPFSNIVQVR